MATYLNPHKGQLKGLNELADNVPITMFNLIKLHPDGGAEKYKTYMAAADPFIKAANAKVVFYGKPHATLIGPQANEWDIILLVSYQSKSDFLSMIKTEGYPHHLRTAALLDSRLVCILQK